jgi:hypothetical protein
MQRGKDGRGSSIVDFDDLFTKRGFWPPALRFLAAFAHGTVDISNSKRSPSREPPVE